MENFTFFEKIKILFNTIVSTPFFSLSALLGLILALLMIIDIVKHKRIRKRYYIAAWFFIFFFIVIRYFKIIPILFDNLVNQIFMALYFPSIGIYMLLLLIINASFIFCLTKNINKSYKVLTGIVSIILDLFFILVVNIILDNKVDVTAEISLYTNSKLLVLLELSTAIFVSWLLLLFFLSAYLKLKKLDNNLLFEQSLAYPKMGTYLIDNNVYIRRVIPAFHKNGKVEPKTSKKQKVNK